MGGIPPLPFPIPLPNAHVPFPIPFPDFSVPFPYRSKYGINIEKQTDGNMIFSWPRAKLELNREGCPVHDSATSSVIYEVKI